MGEIDSVELRHDSPRDWLENHHHRPDSLAFLALCKGQIVVIFLGIPAEDLLIEPRVVIKATVLEGEIDKQLADWGVSGGAAVRSRNLRQGSTLFGSLFVNQIIDELLEGLQQVTINEALRRSSIGCCY